MPKNKIQMMRPVFIAMQCLLFFLSGCHQNSSRVNPDVSNHKQNIKDNNQEPFEEEVYVLLERELKVSWENSVDISQKSNEPYIKILIPCESIQARKIACDQYYVSFFKKDHISFLEDTSVLLTNRTSSLKNKVEPRQNQTRYRNNPEVFEERGSIDDQIRNSEGMRNAILKELGDFLDDDRNLGGASPGKKPIVNIASERLGVVEFKGASQSIPVGRGRIVFSGLKKSIKVTRLKIAKFFSSSESRDIKSLEIAYLERGVARMYETDAEGLKNLVTLGKVEQEDLERLPLKGFEANEILGKDLNHVNVRDQYELTEFVQAQADKHYEKSNKKTIVLGHLPDTHADVWKGSKSIEILDIKEWTLEKNLDWIRDHIQRGSRIVLGSKPREYSSREGGFIPVYHQELRLLLEKGYARVGSEMILMNQVNPRFQNQEVLAGVCIHKYCYSETR